MKRAPLVLVAVAVAVLAGWTLLGRSRTETDEPTADRQQERSSGLFSWFTSATGSSARDGEVPALARKPVRGKVVDALSREPIGGARVVLRSASVDVAESLTDDEGRYGFDEKYGAYAVLVTAPGYGRTGKRLNEGVDLLVELDAAVTLSGVVVSAAGAPVANAEVWSVDLEQNSSPRVESSRVRTDDSGVFHIEDSPAGRLELRAEHDVLPDGAERLGGVGPGRERREIRITLGDSAAVTGFVRRADGAPAGGASVTWHEDQLYETDEATTTASDGSFTLNVRAIAGRLLASVSTGEDVVAKVEPRIGEVTKVDLVLLDQEPVRGRVVDASGAPVEGASVAMSAYGSGDRKTTDTTSGADGSFELRAPSGANVSLTAKKDHASAKRVQVKKGEDSVLTLHATGRLRVRLVDENGERATNTTIYATDEKGRPQDIEKSDVPGELIFVGVPGPWVVVARRNDGVSAEQETKVVVPAAPPESSIEIVVTPPRLGRVRGRVVYEGGKPLAAAHVSVASQIGRESAAPHSKAGRLMREGARRTNASGGFEIEAPIGRQRLFVYHPEYRSTVVLVDVPASGELDAGSIELVSGRSSDSIFESVGIGVQFDSMRAGPPKVRFVFEGTPAEAAGIKPGDVFLEIDGTKLEGMPMKEILPISQGKAGTVAHIRIEREGEEPFELDVARTSYTYSL